MPSARLALALALALAPAGCRKAREIDCGAAAKAWVALAERQLAAEPDADRQAKAAAVLPALREELVHQCRDKGWSLTVRRCIADARTAAELERCDPASADPAAPAAASPPAP